MVTIKNVALVGASGAIGTPVLEALVKSAKFNVTVLTRSSSSSAFPSSVKVIPVDYTSVESLTAALQGQDAVVSTVGTAGLAGQTVFIDAAIAAGVKRFIPSEFGSDLGNPKAQLLPVFGDKVAVMKYIEEMAKTTEGFTYTNIRNGAFLDWGLEMSFLLDWKSGKPAIFDGGDQLFSATTLHSIALAVVGVLEHPEETKNRAVYVQDISTSQNQILAIAKKIAPEKTWEPVPTDLAEVVTASNDALKRGEITVPVMVGYLFQAIFGKGYGGHIAVLDNELLGVPGNKTDADIEAILKPLLASET